MSASTIEVNYKNGGSGWESGSSSSSLMESGTHKHFN